MRIYLVQHGQAKSENKGVYYDASLAVDKNE
jgi:hypothetical protein